MNDLDKPDVVPQFISLLASTERQLNAFILAMVPNFVDADEILQETKVRLWGQFGTYNPDESFDAWARSIAYYQVLTYRRKNSREKLVFSTELLDKLNLSYSRYEEEASHYSDALAACLKGLSKRNQSLLTSVYANSNRISDAAKLLGMTAGAARKALYRSRSALQECINRRLQNNTGAQQ